MSATDTPVGEPATASPSSASTASSKRTADWSWPLHRQHWLRLLRAFALLTGVTALIGWLLTDVLAPNAVTRYDDDANRLVVEASAFVVASFIVGRPRPDVPRLLDSPVDSSFPSGHVAAATIYSALIVIVFLNTRSIAARVAVLAAGLPVPVIVGWARMYQGMHYLSDVVAGVLLGAATIALCAWIMPRPDPSAIRVDDEDEAGRPQRLDVTDGGSTLRPVDDDRRAQGAADTDEPEYRIEHDGATAPTNTPT